MNKLAISILSKEKDSRERALKESKGRIQYDSNLIGTKKRLSSQLNLQKEINDLTISLKIINN